ncbi:MAG: 3-oxoacyl-ACP reductase [Rhodobacteraceae bacterium]|nr:3-oxoacyl-ACP reductase [Paracoccaceae bacterium]MBR28113.1 3-oxoacyl-ACP reductase [Paracoccaceae bacterium]
MYKLDGKTALVTGAAHGIGRAIAFRLAEEGCAVGILDFDREAGEAAAEAIRATGAKAAAAAADVAVKAQVVAGVAELESALGPIDVLVNNAGLCKVGPLLETPDEDWDRTFAINVGGVFHVTRAVVPAMVRRGGGAVVNVASWMGKSGVAAYGAYCASKFAVVSMTQTLSHEIAPSGVRVNAVAPGLIVDTKMRDETEALRKTQGLPSAQDRAQDIPARRPGYPADIANAVAFLASDQAGYITGECINITGGMFND